MQTIALSILELPALATLPDAMESGRCPALISGLSPVHRGLLSAAIALKTRRPVFLICADEAAAEPLRRDLFSLLGQESAYLTGRDFTLIRADSVSREGEQRRLSALSALALQGPAVTVCTAEAMLQRTIPPALLRRAAFTLRVGDTLPIEEAEAALLRCGYVRTDMVEGAGQFSRRGGILDFFSPALPEPVRCEFWGDEIDSMGVFDIASQRRSENLTACEILPAAETLASLCEGGASAVAGTLRAMAARVRRRRMPDRKLEETLLEDAEKLEQSGGLSCLDRYLPQVYDRFAAPADYIPEQATVILCEPNKCRERLREYAQRLTEDIQMLAESSLAQLKYGDLAIEPEELFRRLSDWPCLMLDAFTTGSYPLEPRCVYTLNVRQLSAYGGSTETAVEDIRHYLERDWRVLVITGDERRGAVMRDMLANRGITAVMTGEGDPLPGPGTCALSTGALTAGVELPDIRLAVLTDSQFIQAGFKKPKRRKAAGERIESYSDLTVGDLVVHEQHGIGRFAGIFTMHLDGVDKDYVKLCYAGTDSVYIPATQLDMVSKYIGGGEDGQVKLSRLGGGDWTRAKSRARSAVKALAVDLVELYAQRQRQQGHAFAPDSIWQREFEDAFGWQETDDQLRSIGEIKKDMERPTPMDRLLCGDVGYGKTEVALRAVMKCVLDGCQAAILVPTTVLANQHYQTAMQRFYGYPVKIEVISRFRTGAQLRQTLKNLADGSTDIVIGTHRLLSRDVQFKNLGLLVVDEEQRFGVGHKEHIKEMSRQVDVLTLSATPIPRTLNMALSGIRDMSVLEEPPRDRLPVQTYVIEHDWIVLADAIRRELSRGGQVYYLHNRVENIERTAARLAAMLEGVSVAIAHGQMEEHELSAVMERMVSGEVQVLVCTTIIETGIDIPNVNTLIIEDADTLGLAQLHQLRGRVGRSTRRASAYLTFRKNKILSEIAEKRLSAIREFAEFNSGFRIAMRDLEIRGAGNLLGAEQSGQMIDVGYDMYMRMLEEAVLEQRGEKPVRRAECSADLAVSANIPESYVSSAEQRMDLYRRIALIRTEADADDMTDELIDRFGDPPPGVNTLIHVALLRGEAAAAGITDIAQKSGFLYFGLAELDMARVSALCADPTFKGRVRLDAASKTPAITMKLKTRRVTEEARALVRAYAAADGGWSALSEEKEETP